MRRAASRIVVEFCIFNGGKADYPFDRFSSSLPLLTNNLKGSRTGFHLTERFGCHFLASMLPLKVPTVDAFLARLPQEAAADFVEWSEGKSAGDIYQELLLGEIPVSEFLSPHMNDSITDDRPFNEYFLLRHFWNIVRGKDQQLF